MRLQRVEIRNFRCFKDLTFEVPKNNGLYLLSGKNLTNPRSGSNGSGKSTLMDSITWCLYGQTADGDKSGDLMNLYGSGQGYSVKLVFDEMVIRRTWKPVSRTLDGVEVSQTVLNDAIGLTLEQFLNTIHFAQEGGYFMDLSPGEKLSFLSGVFQLDEWAKCQESSRAKLQLHEMNVRSLQSKVEQTEGVIRYIDERVENLKQQSKSWEDNQKVALKEAEDRFYALKKNEPKPAPLEKLSSMATDLDVKAKNIRKAWEAEEIKVRELTTRKNQADYELKRVNEERFEFSQKEGMTCLECKQVVDETHFNRISRALAERLDVAQKACEALSIPLKLANESLLAAAKQREDIEKNREDLTKLLRQAQSQNNLMAGYLVQLNQASEVCKNLAGAVNPFDGQLVEDTNKKSSYLETLAKQVADLKNSEIVMEQYKFWSAEFPKIRLEILNHIVRELDIHFNQAFYRLGMTDWTCSVHTERELKNENVRRELNIQLQYKGSERRYSGLSGGEKQRIRLATEIGISDLIRAQQSCRWKGFVMIDEPSNNLSPEGVNDMLETLNILSADQVTLFADHGMAHESEFAGVFEFVKGLDECTTLQSKKEPSRV